MAFFQTVELDRAVVRSAFGDAVHHLERQKAVVFGAQKLRGRRVPDAPPLLPDEGRKIYRGRVGRVDVGTHDDSPGGGSGRFAAQGIARAGGMRSARAQRAMLPTSALDDDRCGQCSLPVAPTTTCECIPRRRATVRGRRGTSRLNRQKSNRPREATPTRTTTNVTYHRYVVDGVECQPAAITYSSAQVCNPRWT